LLYFLAYLSPSYSTLVFPNNNLYGLSSEYLLYVNIRFPLCIDKNLFITSLTYRTVVIDLFANVFISSLITLSQSTFVIIFNIISISFEDALSIKNLYVSS